MNNGPSCCAKSQKPNDSFMPIHHHALVVITGLPLTGVLCRFKVLQVAIAVILEFAVRGSLKKMLAIATGGEEKKNRSAQPSQWCADISSRIG